MTHGLVALIFAYNFLLDPLSGLVVPNCMWDFQPNSGEVIIFFYLLL